MTDAPSRSARPFSRRTAVLIQLAAGIAVTVLLLVAIELVSALIVRSSRRKDVGPLRIVEGGDTVSETLRHIDSNPVPLVPDLDLLWRPQRSVTKTQPVNPLPFDSEETWTLRTNSKGFRTAEIAEKRPGTYRIVCIGDSITYGFNVEEPASYPRRLERALREMYPGSALEVINAGVPGWSWVQGLHFLKREALAWRPDLVIAAHGSNDRFFPARITDVERLGLLENDWLRSRERLLLFLAGTNTYRVLMAAARPAASLDEPSPACARQIAETGMCRRVALSEIESSIMGMYAVAHRERFDLLILNLDFIETDAVQGTKKAVERTGIAFKDVVPIFREVNAREDERRSRELGVAVPGKLGSNANAVLLRVLEPRGGQLTTRGNSEYLGPSFQFDELMFDDGTHGDEVAGDGIHSVLLQLPAGVHALRFGFYRNAEPEFVPLPPLPPDYKNRLIRFSESVIAPVAVFGQQLLMTEETHPNARGHEVIAAAVVEAVLKIPSFRYAVGKPRTGSAASDGTGMREDARR